MDLASGGTGEQEPGSGPETSSASEPNPFAALFSQVCSTQLPPELATGINHPDSPVKLASDSPRGDLSNDCYEINELIQRIFLFTVEENHQSYSPSIPTGTGRGSGGQQLVMLAELAESLQIVGQTWIDFPHLQEALFERLRVDNPTEFLVPKSDNNYATDASESGIMAYLYQSYKRSMNEPDLTATWRDMCRDTIFTNCLTCLVTPAELYGGQNVHEQLVQLFTGLENINSTSYTFLTQLIQFIHNSEEATLNEVLYPIFNVIVAEIQKFDIAFTKSIEVHVGFLSTILSEPHAAQVFMEYHKLADKVLGKAYENTLLGTILKKSSIVQDHERADFFKPASQSKSEIERQEEHLKLSLERVHKMVYELLKPILRNKACKDLFHQWLGDCIKANEGRTKLRGLQSGDTEFASDAFFLNLTCVCLRLVHSFTSEHPTTSNVLKIKPSFSKCTCAVVEKDRHDTGVHYSFSKETFLVSLPEGSPPIETEVCYPSLTEMFFFAHKIFHLAFHRIHSKFSRLIQELHRMESQNLNEMRNNARNSPHAEALLNRFDQSMARFLSVRAALNEPTFTTLAIDFLKTTSVLLCHYGQSNSNEAPLLAPVVFLNETTLRSLSCIPEFFLQNISDFIMYNRRFNEGKIDSSVLSSFQSFFTMYMPYKERITNPHMRAQLAECLEITLAHDDINLRGTSLAGRALDMQKIEGFKALPLKNDTSFALIKLFVDIESSVSGDDIHFEQKFMYRRPMLKMLDIMWTIPEYKLTICKLAQSSLADIEAANVPVFVRFINLLLNDSIYLLDEAMQYITQIRTMERQRDSGEWARLPPPAAMQRESNLRNVVQITRFHNIMSNDIVHCLRFLTTEIKDLFVHPTFLERVASMLNYFLKKLVGSERSDLHVKSLQKQIEFKPKRLVKDICYIYINLASTYPEEIAGAIARDGRSYSKDLFTNASQVLYKISTDTEVEGEVTIDLINQLEKLGVAASAASDVQKDADEEMGEAPEEFLDPIMSHIMQDPVTLPTSGATLDRATIARHLLTDQTDPFNRQPLTMDQVKPNDELKAKITKWLVDKQYTLPPTEGASSQSTSNNEHANSNNAAGSLQIDYSPLDTLD